MAADDASPDVVIVGAGIAGLTAAWHLRHLRLLVLEAGPLPGGRIRSEPRGDYWLNFGPHLFPGPDTVLGRLVTSAGLETVPVTGSTLALSLRGTVLTSGRTWAYPFMLPMSLPARASLARAGLIIRRGVRAYAQLGQQRPGETGADITRRLLSFQDDQSFAEHLGPLHPDADAILRAAIRRVSAEPEELSAGAGMAQFAATFSPAGTSLHHNLAGGTSRLVEALTQGLKDCLRTSCQVTAVRQRGGSAEVEWLEHGAIRRTMTRQVIVATPAPAARQIIKDLPSGTADGLSAIRYGPYVVAAMLTAERSAMPWDGIYAMVTPGRAFNLLFNTASILRGPGQRRPGGSLMAYGASDLARRLLDRSDGQICDAFLQDLAATYAQLPGLVSEIDIQRWPEGIPFSTPGRHRWQPALEQPNGCVYLAGDYLGARGGMDTAAVSGHDAARKVLRALQGTT